MSIEEYSNHLRIRNAANEDIGFLFNSWLKSYRTALAVKYVSNTIYFDSHHKLIEELLKRCDIKIACSAEDPSQIFGYIVSERVDGILCVHYTYVKQSFRNMGIAKALLKTVNHDVNTASVYTHQTDQAHRQQAKYNFVYHPYLAHTKPKKEEA